MLMLQGTLKFREKLSARLADVLSCLYLASAVLKRFEDQGRPQDDLILLEWVCEDTLYRIQQSFDELIRNFPNRPAAWLLRFLVFPIGKPYRAPDDRLGHRVASLLLSPSPARDRLTAGIYLPTDPREPTGRLEAALHAVLAAEAVEEKLRAAVHSGKLKSGDEEFLLREGLKSGVINEEEAERVRRAIALRREAIMVDDFPPDYWTKTTSNPSSAAEQQPSKPYR